MEHNKNTKFKICLFYGIMCLMIVFCIEVLSQLSFFIIFGKRYSAENLKNYVAHKYDSTDQKANFLKETIIHPYVGHVHDFGDEKHNFLSQGFLTNISPLVKKEAGKMNVVILGGSVGAGLAKYIERAWEKTFKVNLRLINLAMGGFKQPQQLMTLTYFLSLGAEYDLVINIDGLNDIVLPYVENYVAGISPFFPRSWKLRISDHLPPQELALVGKVKYSQDLKQQRLAELSGSIFNSSATYGLIKMVQLIINNKEIYDSSTALFVLQRKSPKRFVESGPLEHYANNTEMHKAAAGLWYRCSLLINSLAKDNNFEYYHVLQPDQYYEGSKRLTKEEKRIAFNKKHLYRQSVIIGYPMLIENGKALLKNNVNFIDGTMIFANVSETVYADDCCHYNEIGNEIMADYIIEKIKNNSKLDSLRLTGASPK